MTIEKAYDMSKKEFIANLEEFIRDCDEDTTLVLFRISERKIKDATNMHIESLAQNFDDLYRLALIGHIVESPDGIGIVEE